MEATGLQISITQLDDDGSRITPEVEPGTVEAEPTETATDTQTATLAVSESLTATATDSPTQTESVTVSPAARTVTETGGPGFTAGLAVLALLGVVMVSHFRE